MHVLLLPKAEIDNGWLVTNCSGFYDATEPEGTKHSAYKKRHPTSDPRGRGSHQQRYEHETLRLTQSGDAVDDDDDDDVDDDVVCLLNTNQHQMIYIF